MQVKVEVIKQDDSPDRAKTLHVETHARRGTDAFNIEKVDNVDEGNTVTFNVPNGGRLVLNTPIVHNEPVLDRDQMASIHPTQQVNKEGVADRGRTPAEIATGARTTPTGETPEQRKLREDQARAQQVRTAQGNPAPAAGARTVGGTPTSGPSAGVPPKKPGDDTTEKPQP